MNFTLPIRPSSGRRWARSEAQTQDAPQVEPVDDDAGRNKSTHALRSMQSLHNLNSAKPENPLRSAKSTNRLRHAPSRSQLGPVNNDRVVKPSQRKAVAKPSSEISPSVPKIAAKVDLPVSKIPEDEISEETWALVQDHVEQEEKAKELDKDLARMNVKAKQSIRRIRSMATLPDQKESIEETVQHLTPADIPVNIHLFLGFQSFDRQSFLGARPIRILVNELPDLDAFSTELQAVHGEEKGVMLLRSIPPKRWRFQSRLDANQVGNHVTIGGFEYHKTCEPEDAQGMYVEFLRFLYEKGQREAKELVGKAKERMESNRRARKGVAEFAVEGYRRELPQVQVPEAVDVQGYVEVFL
ncbi:hypothetical protein H2200_007404 [Cladophialophora chaetospira]|uniref:Uncharacterized protein n=1 Tax=Cladophialophora chaetospira TaxID=386627 RepID=A0AA38X894_9EURO|nr:hypothetical protein H2200_007404 [Cladophialophora chaetospira]